MSVTKPTNNPIPFGQSGLINTIPATTIVSGKASFMTGFPAITMAQKALGGLAPDGKDMNGVLNHIDQHTVWQTAGGQYQYDSVFATEIGGYPIYSELQSNDGLTTYVSNVDGNMTNPNTGGAGWLVKSGGAISSGLSIARASISSVSSGLSVATSSVSSVSSGLSIVSTGLSNTNSSVSSISSSLSNNTSSISAISSGLSTTTSSVSAVSGGLSNTNSSVSAISSSLSINTSSISAISSGLSINTSSISAISSGLSVTSSVVSSLSSGIGYRTGQGAAVTQLTDKSTAVTMNNLTGKITMNNQTLAANGQVAFTLNNSLITANDFPAVNIASGATALTYAAFIGSVSAGSCTIILRNFTGTGQSDAVVLNFILFKGANS